jgi:hypothetical protein
MGKEYAESKRRTIEIAIRTLEKLAIEGRTRVITACYGFLVHFYSFDYVSLFIPSGLESHSVSRVGTFAFRKIKTTVLSRIFQGCCTASESL